MELTVELTVEHNSNSTVICVNSYGVGNALCTFSYMINMEHSYFAITGLRPALRQLLCF